MVFPQIISGGQTGADRAGLNWAISNGVPHGGWCPRGRKAEDGPIPNAYLLQETVSADYPERTEKNVLFSDATVIFTLAPKLGRGSRLTVKLAQRLQKPWLHIHSQTPQPGKLLAAFICSKQISRLNVAGSRASKEPGIGEFVQHVLDQARRLLLNVGCKISCSDGLEQNDGSKLSGV
jgi:hypothetical protein